eukprot:TRINITY_DN1380_c0_g1_i1.p1 TRINITY_DN1380_c0_g1~~TRINITY_DN1380_c0_g1_i1.p1  ORF type:complete len:564 (-),score=123.57 TRINITY_DN1380_c0_g1_i1:779-2470(-)
MQRQHTAMQRQHTADWEPIENGASTENVKPLDHFANPLLNDMYQFTMAYSYWKSGKHNDHSVFDLYFRKNPFHGEFTIFAGLEEVLRFLNDFHVTQQQADYLRSIMAECDEEFFTWLRQLDCSQVNVHALKEGSICFPSVPLLRVEGPLGICQILETPLLCLVNFPSLVCTNAVRHRLAAGPNKTLLEFGLRRAQGPNGGMSASRYSYMGGFDGTSNVLAGMLFGMHPRGTHAHAYVTSFTGSEKEVAFLREQGNLLDKKTGTKRNLYEVVERYLTQVSSGASSKNELIAFTNYALSFPNGFLSLVDTYDTLKSGVPNFLAVALALLDFGYSPVGIRLDSGDLAYLSKRARQVFCKLARELSRPELATLKIVASNDLNESTILSLNQQGHEIDTFGIGTNLVTCQAQPALGCVYKLVEINHVPRIKLSQEVSKVNLPGRKNAYRLYKGDGEPLVDLIMLAGQEAPQPGARVLCCHPFMKAKRLFAIPSHVENLHHHVFKDGKINTTLPSMDEIRAYVQTQLKSVREDHLRPMNPTPYKVSVSQELHDYLHNLWIEEMPIPSFS